MTSPRPAGRPRWTVVLTLVSVGVLACVALVLAVRESRDETERAVTRPPVFSPSPTPSASSPEPPAGSPESIPAVSALEAGAVPDDGADDTAALSAALRELAGSGTALHLPSGTYDVDRLTVPEGSRLVGDGASRTWLRGSVELGGHCRMSDLKVGTDGRSFRFVDGATRSHIERVTFVGGGSFDAGQDQGVIRFGEGRSASYITFDDCTIGANSGDANGVSIVDQGRADATYHHLTWRRCTFESSPCMGFECIQRPQGSLPYTTGYHAIDLIDCTFQPSGSQSVSYDAYYQAGYSRVTGCTFLGSGWNDAYPWGQTVEFNRTRDMVFSGNTVYRGRGALINHNGVPGERTGTVFRDNVFDSTVSHFPIVPSREVQVIYMNNVSDALFTGNVIRSDVGGELAYISGSSSNTFSGNRWLDVRPAARALPCVKLTDGARGNTFTGELFRTGAPAGAIVAQRSSSALVEDSVFAVSGGRPATTDASSRIVLVDDE